MDAAPGPRHLDLLGCAVDFAACVARWPDGERALTPTENKLLRYLCAQGGRAVGRQELLKEVWGYRGGVVTRTVKTTMGRLRAKVERDPQEPEHLLTVTGVGYRFAAPDDGELAVARVDAATQSDRASPLEASDDELPTRTNLPREAPTLLGRERELARLVTLTDSGSRLCTLVGTGGIGKTALLLRFAEGERQRGGWREIRLADLSACSRAEDVVRAVATALDVRVEADDFDASVAFVAGALRARGAILLLLDDAERAAADLAQVLSRWLVEVPRASFVVTSRELLRIAGETPLVVGPLASDAAVALFQQRLAVAPEAYDAAALLPVVEQLDGVPLAIEMAAAWGELLGPDALLKRLGRQLDLLRSDRRDRPARHESLRATVASSWDLLEGHERAGLQQLAVFAGPFGVEDADAVLDLSERTGSPPTVLSLLRRLRERSLLRADPVSADDEPRFRLFRAVRDYAREQGGDEGARQRHGVWFARWGATATLVRLARGGGAEVGRLAGAREDLVLATRRALRRDDAGVAVACARALALLTELRGPALVDESLLAAVAEMPSVTEGGRAFVEEGRALLLAGLGRPDEARVAVDAAARSAIGLPIRERAILLVRLATVLIDRSPDESDALVDRALADAVAADDDAALGLALAVKARLDHLLGRPREAEERFERALALLRVVGEKRTEARTLEGLALLHAERGRPLRARSLFEQALSLQREVGDRHASAPLLDAIASLLSDEGERQRAAATWEEALQGARDNGDRRVEARVRAHRAVSERRNDAGESARHGLLAALTLSREVGDRALEAELLHELGELDLSLGHLAAADSYLQRSLQGARRLALPTIEGACRGALGELHAARGDLATARQELAAGRVLLDGAHMRLAVVELLERWAEVEAGAGEEGHASRLLLEAAAASELSVVDGPIVGR